VTIGSPSSVTTTVIGKPPVEPPPPTTPGEPPPPTVPDAPPPLVVQGAVRYGFHHQPTVLVVTFSTDWNSDARSNPATYTVLVSANGAHRVVPVSGVYYDPETRRATLRVSDHIYLYRPWRLVISDAATDSSGHPLVGGAEDATALRLVTRMNRRSLVGPASRAPGASHVGIKAAPGGPLALRAKHNTRAHTARPVPAKLIV
jgi:hypothetical protein